MATDFNEVVDDIYSKMLGLVVDASRVIGSLEAPGLAEAAIELAKSSLSDMLFSLQWHNSRNDIRLPPESQLRWLDSKDQWRKFACRSGFRVTIADAKTSHVRSYEPIDDPDFRRWLRKQASLAVEEEGLRFGKRLRCLLPEAKN